MNFVFLFALVGTFGIAFADQVCYNQIGCFTNDAPFEKLPLPQDPYKTIPPTYYLHRLGQGVQKIYDSSELAAEVIFLVHGYTESYADSYEKWIGRMVEKLQQVKPQADIIFLDWEKGARMGAGLTVYTQAASNTRTIGAALAAFINTNPSNDASKYHCIGFSLGAQVCGFAGKRLTRRWGRISALDPAALGFSSKEDTTGRIAKGDADFVDVLHTSALGLHFAVGDSDFWVNNVKQQPGCYDEADGVTDYVALFFSCSHLRAHQLYIETINPEPSCKFTFCPCSSWTWNQLGMCKTCKALVSAEAGYKANLSPNRGEFYGSTTDAPPFCLGSEASKTKGSRWWGL